jgi:hypothetical protein
MHVPAKLNRKPIPEGTRIELREGAHIHLTTKFKYLGSKITSNLSDNLDVNTRIAIVNSQMGQMKVFQMQGHIKKDQEVSIPSNITNHCDTRGRAQHGRWKRKKKEC